MLYQSYTRLLFLAAAGAFFVAACGDSETSASSSGSSSSTGMSAGAGGESSSSTGTMGSGGAGQGGAGQGGAGEGPLACDNHEVNSTCADYPAGTTQAEATMTCDKTVIMMPCSLDNAVGTCSIITPKGTLTNTYYSDGPMPWTEAAASAECMQSMGEFKKP